MDINIVVFTVYVKALTFCKVSDFEIKFAGKKKNIR